MPANRDTHRIRPLFKACAFNVAQFAGALLPPNAAHLPDTNRSAILFRNPEARLNEYFGLKMLRKNGIVWLGIQFGEKLFKQI